MSSTSRSNAIAPSPAADGSAPRPIRSAFGTLAGLLRRHRPGPPAPPKPGEIRPLFDGDRPGRTALVSMLEVDPALVGPIVAATRKRLARFDRIVYLTSHDDFRPFRAAKVPFEYWPPLADMWARAEDLPWPAYLRSKRALLLSKWRPGLQVSYGLDFDGYVARAPDGRPTSQ